MKIEHYLTMGKGRNKRNHYRGGEGKEAERISARFRISD